MVRVGARTGRLRGFPGGFPAAFPRLPPRLPRRRVRSPPPRARARRGARRRPPAWVLADRSPRRARARLCTDASDPPPPSRRRRARRRAATDPPVSFPHSERRATIRRTRRGPRERTPPPPRVEAVEWTPRDDDPGHPTGSSRPRHPPAPRQPPRRVVARASRGAEIATAKRLDVRSKITRAAGPRAELAPIRERGARERRVRFQFLCVGARTGRLRGFPRGSPGGAFVRLRRERAPRRLDGEQVRSTTGDARASRRVRRRARSSRANAPGRDVGWGGRRRGWRGWGGRRGWRLPSLPSLAILLPTLCAVDGVRPGARPRASREGAAPCLRSPRASWGRRCPPRGAHRRPIVRGDGEYLAPPRGGDVLIPGERRRRGAKGTRVRRAWGGTRRRWVRRGVRGRRRYRPPRGRRVRTRGVSRGRARRPRRGVWRTRRRRRMRDGTSRDWTSMAHTAHVMCLGSLVRR